MGNYIWSNHKFTLIKKGTHKYTELIYKKNMLINIVNNRILNILIAILNYKLKLINNIVLTQFYIVSMSQTLLTFKRIAYYSNSLIINAFKVFKTPLLIIMYSFIGIWYELYFSYLIVKNVSKNIWFKLYTCFSNYSSTRSYSLLYLFFCGGYHN